MSRCLFEEDQTQVLGSDLILLDRHFNLQLSVGLMTLALFEEIFKRFTSQSPGKT